MRDCQSKKTLLDPLHSSATLNICAAMAGSSGGGSDEENKEEGVYCICRTSDTSRFMIGCDNCNEWYHGDCISITPEFSRNISKFFCLLCRTGNPALKTIFKGDKKSCGECSACVRSQNCGKCDTCLDGAGKKCRKRICKVRPRLCEKNSFKMLALQVLLICIVAEGSLVYYEQIRFDLMAACGIVIAE